VVVGGGDVVDLWHGIRVPADARCPPPTLRSFTTAPTNRYDASGASRIA
jgi:hypothetical protein